jgi:hypothetical protein
MNKYKTIIVGSIFIMALFVAGCVEQEDDIDNQVEDGTLQLKITDKPGDLDILYANVTISMVQVHKAGADDDEEDENGDSEEYENIDEYDDGFIAEGYGPYFAEVGENITFMGNATGGLTPYNWSWDFGDGNLSYEQNATHNYSADGEYTVNLTVTDDNGSGVIDWYITTATIGTINDDEDMSTAGWYTIVEEDQTFDLIALQDVEVILGENDLSPGKYTQIRLTVKNAELTINNSGMIEVHDMKIPSSKVKLIKAFWINEGETTILTLDFDVHESVHQTGNNKFIMKPTIKVIEG